MNPVPGASTLRGVVTDALAQLCSDLAADGSVRGTAAEWERATRTMLVERYGDAGIVARAAGVQALLATDMRTAALLAFSGLIAHPRVALALCEAMQ